LYSITNLKNFFMYQVATMFIKMSGIDKVMFIVWSIGLIGMAVSMFKLITLTIVSNFSKVKSI
jgi:hypothetical protein